MNLKINNMKYSIDTVIGSGIYIVTPKTDVTIVDKTVLIRGPDYFCFKDKDNSNVYVFNHVHGVGVSQNDAIKLFEYKSNYPISFVRKKRLLDKDVTIEIRLQYQSLNN